MAGHSKWANIKHKKAREDAKRGKIFTKLIKEITVTARLGGGDLSANPRLRQLVEKAKQENMPQENMMRAIKKGTGELPGVQYEPIMYEGYGPHGIAVLVDCLTDNKNRTVAEMRRLFSSKGGNLGETGAVNWMFEHLGVIRIDTPKHTEDELLELLIEHDIQDIATTENSITVICNAKSLNAVKVTLEQSGETVNSAELEWIAKNKVSLEDSAAEKAYEFLSTLDDHDDVQNVFTNLG